MAAEDMQAKIRLATRADADAWLAMRAALWPEAAVDELRGEVAAYFTARRKPLLLHRVFVAEIDGRPVGILELSLRPYADGCASSPVPFIEAWFVVSEARRRGVGAALVNAAQQWALKRGYAEIASDALLDNAVSHRAHAALGFEEVERVVRFRKMLEG
jgi:aminoglycoside 6'-N-acetyltransferase I